MDSRLSLAFWIVDWESQGKQSQLDDRWGVNTFFYDWKSLRCKNKYIYNIALKIDSRINMSNNIMDIYINWVGRFHFLRDIVVILLIEEMDIDGLWLMWLILRWSGH